ncbi:hypothetical protein T10_13481 [Trichinella papuae]|uniref:Uncharacterized protein n=1 Tax=Trichinella papuae TaxID=268474 RepID=A0A0V1M9F8_9BILA|nr:hypothetical protein T10_13481 [Trichinella papuae]
MMHINRAFAEIFHFLDRTTARTSQSHFYVVRVARYMDGHFVEVLHNSPNRWWWNESSFKKRQCKQFVDVVFEQLLVPLFRLLISNHRIQLLPDLRIAIAAVFPVHSAQSHNHQFDYMSYDKI